MNKFDEALEALVRKANMCLKFPLTLDKVLTYTKEVELNAFITGYLVGSGKYEPDDDVEGYIYNLIQKYPDFGKFANH